MFDPSIDPSKLPPALTDRLPPKLALAWNVLPLDEAGGVLRVAVPAGREPELLDNLAALVRADIRAESLDGDLIRSRLRERYGLGASEIDDGAPAVAAEAPTRDDSAMARFVDELISRARAERATDVHIEPGDGAVTVRFRIDGLLRLQPVPAALARQLPRLVSRLKVMSGLNIAEKRRPQDGRLHLSAGADVDVRISTIPTIHGETVGLRLLPRRAAARALDGLGLAEDTRLAVEALVARPNGILLVTGPTGHGKTTTLHAILSRLTTSERKVVTIEDPVEVRLAGASQIQAHPQIGLTFAAALRAVLRQDPDILMVGEIRDRDTAEIAIRASLTGHLVFSTLHTNDSASAVTRLLDMGVDAYLVASSVNGVLAQRLVRLLCPACGGTGCGACGGAGFRHRTGLFELMPMTEALRAGILAGTAARDLRRLAVRDGMRTLFEDGRRKAALGLTTLDEVRRVVEDAA